MFGHLQARLGVHITDQILLNKIFFDELVVGEAHSIRLSQVALRRKVEHLGDAILEYCLNTFALEGVIPRNRLSYFRSNKFIGGAAKGLLIDQFRNLGMPRFCRGRFVETLIGFVTINSGFKKGCEGCLEILNNITHSFPCELRFGVKGLEKNLADCLLRRLGLEIGSVLNLEEFAKWSLGFSKETAKFISDSLCPEALALKSNIEYGDNFLELAHYIRDHQSEVALSIAKIEMALDERLPVLRPYAQSGMY